MDSLVSRASTLNNEDTGYNCFSLFIVVLNQRDTMNSDLRDVELFRDALFSTLQKPIQMTMNSGETKVNRCLVEKNDFFALKSFNSVVEAKAWFERCDIVSHTVTIAMHGSREYVNENCEGENGFLELQSLTKEVLKPRRAVATAGGGSDISLETRRPICVALHQCFAERQTLMLSHANSDVLFLAAPGPVYCRGCFTGFHAILRTIFLFDAGFLQWPLRNDERFRSMTIIDHLAVALCSYWKGVQIDLEPRNIVVPAESHYKMFVDGSELNFDSNDRVNELVNGIADEMELAILNSV